jgi:hypothetical protein
MPRRGPPISAGVLDAAIADFNAKVRNFARKVVPEQTLTFYTRLGLEVLRNVVFLTPVDTGRARGNWQLTIGSPAIGQRDDFKSRDVVSEGAAVLGNMKGLEVVWISNNVPYIGLLERGSSRQAPAGMVAVTLATIGQTFSD